MDVEAIVERPPSATVRTFLQFLRVSVLPNISSSMTCLRRVRLYSHAVRTRGRGCRIRTPVLGQGWRPSRRDSSGGRRRR